MSKIGSLLVCCTVAGLWGLGCVGSESDDEQGAVAEPLAAQFVKTRVVAGLEQPTAMAIAPDGRFFIAQRGTNNTGGTATARVRVVKNGTLLATPFVSVTVDNAHFDCCNERGLVGLTLDPAFAQNGFVYVYYTVPGSPPHNRVSRFTAAGDVAQSGSEKILMELDGLTAPNHNGGAMHFGADGKLYVAVGNNVVNSNSQAIANRHGKMLRINSDGTIPTDNPTTLAGISGTPQGANRAIWAVGLRNPFTFAVHPTSGRIFVNDVGEGQREEIDELGKARNYGWPLQEGFLGSDNANFTRPIVDYAHNDAGSCAITGGAFYHPANSTFGSGFLDKYFFTDFCGGWIRLLDPSTRSVTAFDAGYSQPVDLQVGNDGALYVLTAGAGELWRIQTGGGGSAQQRIVVSTTAMTVAEGGTGTFRLSLAAAPAANVVVALGVRTGDPSIKVSHASLLFTPTNWNVPQTITITALVNPAVRLSVSAVVACTSPGLPTADVLVTARDVSPSGPSALISLPHEGDVVSGPTVDFFGQNEGPATTTKGEFYIDGVLKSTDVVTAPPGHYHYKGSHQSLDTTGLSSGRHMLALKVYTATGETSTHQISVDVRNGVSSGAGVKVNFQLGSAPVPAGYLPDAGQLYGARNGRTYGWNIDHTDVTRDRGIHADQRLDTLCHVHRGGVWEIAVPNGAYRVTVSIGDPQFASTHTLNVEGTNYWNAIALGVNAFASATKTVTVNDGKLTVDQGSAIDKATRINYIEIAPL